MSPSSDAITQKNCYHHCIPRFILRQFARVALPGQPSTSVLSLSQCAVTIEGKKRRRKKVPKSRLIKGPRPNTLFFYELSSASLQDRLLRKVYGKTNLYRDMNNPANIDHLEDKLAGLEGDASAIIYRIHAGIQSRMFSLSREELATLRKFIFLMHYRNDAISSTYFEENSPNNAPLSDWIRNYRETRQLQGKVDLWLDGLKYYLDTPHHAIVAAGERLRERYGEHRLQDMLRHRLDPEIEEEYYAIDYERLANYFFLGVWEAAENTEFVLGGNAFGLWEGLIHGSPGAHRLYVMSPRIAIVLRRTFIRHPQFNDPSILYSCLAEIPIAPPHIKYADPNVLVDPDSSDPTILKNARDAYRSSTKAQKDHFTFAITKLTCAQTYAVNEVIMMNANLHPEGSVTFFSPAAMLETLKAYMASHNTFLGGGRLLFQPLLRDLFALIASNSPTTIPSLDFSRNVDTDADRQLHMFLRFTVIKGISFPSSYNRAYLVFHMATDIPSLTNPVSSEILSICENAIAKVTSILDPPVPSILPTNSLRVLVETLPKEESELFFALVGHQVDQLGVGGRSNDMLANIIYEAAIIGITYWLALNRPDILTDLLTPWVTILI